MAHLTAVGHTRDELEQIGEKLWNTGIRNIMALRGDTPKDSSNSIRSDFRFGSELIAFLKSRFDFCCGGGCYPEGHLENPDLSIGIEHLKLKVDSGCEFLVTQMFFDSDAFLTFRDRAVAAGINVPIVPGLMPITDFKQANKFESKFGVTLPVALKESIDSANEDQELVNRAGVAWTTRQCTELLQEGVPGIHFYTLNKAEACHSVCEILELSGRHHAVTDETANC